MSGISDGLSLVDFAIRGVRASIETVNAIADAPRTIQNLRVDLEATEVILHRLEEPANRQLVQQQQQSGGVQRALRHCEVTCTSLQDKLAQWTRHSNSASATSGGISKRDRLILGFFRKESIKAIRDELKDCREGVGFVVEISSS